MHVPVHRRRRMTALGALGALAITTVPLSLLGASPAAAAPTELFISETSKARIERQRRYRKIYNARRRR